MDFILSSALLFVSLSDDMAQPLAERMRPKTLDEYIGQRHLVGEGAVLRKMIDAGRVSSFLLWGPPGVGKTTLAQIIAHKLDTPFYTLSAVTSGVKDVRDVIERAKSGRFFNEASPILFIDEIHRFSKSQQDSLLGAVEKGIVTLIGATTENPSFEVIRPLLSRCQLYVLKSLEKDDLLQLLHRAITEDVELIPMSWWRTVCNRIPWHTTKTGRCTTTLSLPLSRVSAEAIPMQPSIGWPG